MRRPRKADHRLCRRSTWPAPLPVGSAPLLVGSTPSCARAVNRLAKCRRLVAACSRGDRKPASREGTARLLGTSPCSSGILGERALCRPVAAPSCIAPRRCAKCCTGRRGASPASRSSVVAGHQIAAIYAWSCCLVWRNSIGESPTDVHCRIFKGVSVPCRIECCE